jgi:hypothetical protein
MKDWFVGGPIRPEDRKRFYYVPRQDIQDLIHNVKNKCYMLYYSHRQAGKTSKMFQLMSEIGAKYNTVMVSFQSGIDFTNVHTFWITFLHRLRMERLDLFPEYWDKNVLEKQNPKNLEISFIDFFKNYKHEKSTVLIIDEMDNLLLGADEVQNSFLGALRSLKNVSNLTSFIGVGVFNLKYLCTNRITGKTSPFNVSDLKLSLPFSKLEHDQLFDEFIKDSGIQIDKKVVEDIYAICKGYEILQ